jgi:hypothetical protein
VRVQRKENLPVGELRRKPVRCMDRERGLADAGHPANRVHPDHPACLRGAYRRAHQLPQFGLAASEGAGIARQGARRCRRSWRRLARLCESPGGRLELSPDSASQPERIGQQFRCLVASGRVDAALEVTDRARAEARGRGQVLLGHSGCGSQLAQERGEGNGGRFLRGTHSLTPPR